MEERNQIEETIETEIPTQSSEEDVSFTEVTLDTVPPRQDKEKITREITVSKEPAPQALEKTEIQPECGCGGGGEAENLGYIYAIGNIYPTFPSTSIEEEYKYAYEQFKSEGPPDALFYQVLSQGQNLYIAQRICWILQVEGIDTYIIKPRSDVELYYLIDALKPINTGERKFDVVIGPRGPIATPDMCNGIQLPTMVCNLSYNFTFNQFVAAVVAEIPGIPQTVVVNMLESMLKISDNAGETDAHRAINYLTIRSRDIYTMAAEMQNPNPSPPYPSGVFFLQSINVEPSNVQGNRKVVNVIFAYQSRDTSEQAYWYVKVDVTGQFPFMASRQLSRYYPAP